MLQKTNMTSPVTYLYTENNLIEKPNTYQYSQYNGVDFLIAWRKSRESVLAYLPSPLDIPCGINNLYKNEVIITKDLLNLLVYLIEHSTKGNPDHELNYWSSRLVKKFEVSKRIYSAYQLDMPHRPALNSHYDDIFLYLRFSEFLLLNYQKTESIQYLNLLLKVIDTLVSVHKKMISNHAARLHTLILTEMKIIASLGIKNGVQF